VREALIQSGFMAPRSAPARTRSDLAVEWGFLEWFVISQMALPALLYLPGTQSLRVPLRIAAFGISLAALLLHRPAGRGAERAHPSSRWLWLALVYISLMIFHPWTNTLLAGVGQALLYLAVMAPLFWSPPLVRGPEQLWRLLGIILICSGVNSIVGILQVHDPDRWLPREYSAVVAQSSYGLLTYTRPDGTVIVRPPGLSDNPGAVCGPGMIAAALGLIFAASPLAMWKRAGALLLALAGTAAIYLSQVRTSVLILAGTLLIYLLLLLAQRESVRAIMLTACGAAVLALGWLLAAQVGGAGMLDRFFTLWEDDPATLYYNAGRAGQLQDAFRLQLKRYPLGAGLGRWGMMRVYFGDERNWRSPPIWAELQLPAWLFDGGVVLIALYGVALIANASSEYGLIRSARRIETRRLATIVFALNAGTLALCFGFAPFTSQIGLQYWFLAGALQGVALRERRQE
jgi:hypothetical protein